MKCYCSFEIGDKPEKLKRLVYIEGRKIIKDEPLIVTTP